MKDNKSVIKKYVDRFNDGDLNGLAKLFAPNAVVYGVLGWGQVTDVIPIWKQLVDSLAMRLEIEDIVTEGHVVAARYRETGTSRAPFFEKPATGRSYEITAMEWFEIKDNKIQRRWGARDAASQAQQLGWDVPATRKDVSP